MKNTDQLQALEKVRDAEPQACQNTDKELWRTVEGDYYSKHKLYLTEGGGLTLCEGGTCITLPPEDWFRLAGNRFVPTPPKPEQAL